MRKILLESLQVCRVKLYELMKLDNPSKIGFFVSFSLHAFVAIIFLTHMLSVPKIEISPFDHTQISLSQFTSESRGAKQQRHKKAVKHKKNVTKDETPKIPEQANIETTPVVPSEEPTELTESSQGQGEDIEFISSSGQYDEFYSSVWNEIRKNQHYPAMMKKRRIQDEVVCEFVIYKDGRVANINLIKPSHYDDFNYASIKAIKKASKRFPRAPKNVRLQITMAYNLV